MSVRLLGRAFYADLPAHLKLTLLALCDEASEDGSGICIGQARLARKVGATDRTVRSNLGQLEARGWIHKLAEKSAKYRTDQWEIEVEKLPHGPETSSAETPERTSGRRGASPEAERQPDRKLSVVGTGSPLPPTQELPVTTTQELSPRKARERDPIFDALAEIEGLNLDEIDPDTGRRIGVARAQLLRNFAEVTPGEIVRRAANYGTHFDGAPLTAGALVKWWLRCATPGRNGRGSGGGQAHELAAELRERGL